MKSSDSGKGVLQNPVPCEEAASDPFALGRQRPSGPRRPGEEEAGEGACAVFRVEGLRVWGFGV